MDLKHKKLRVDEASQDTTDAPPSKRPRSVDLNGENEQDPQARNPPSSEAPKRKRGRPLGSKSKTERTERTDRIIAGFVPSSSPPPTNGRSNALPYRPSIETPKRKRGRPRGSKTKRPDQINGFVPSSSPPTANGFGRHAISAQDDHRDQIDEIEQEEDEDEPQFDSLKIGNGGSRELAELEMKRMLAGDDSEGEDLEEEHDQIRKQLVDSTRTWRKEVPESDDEGVSLNPTPAPPKKRGRPKGSVRERFPTPPLQDLPPYERYFYQNRLGAVKTSDNTLSSLKLLEHDEYFEIMNRYKDPHHPERQYLEELHSRSFPQWQFELHEGFNICLYGWGSKRELVNRYATWLHSTLTSQGHDASRRIIIINGYVSTLTTRDILSTINTTIHPHRASDTPIDLQSTLSQLPKSHPPLTLLVNSIDSPSLRRPTSQSFLASLSAHPGINFLATADVPNFPLLWDSTLRETFNFLFHDCTTFAPFSTEIDVVESVHELLGRSSRRIGGREGVAFVLRSLPENAKKLYRLLVGEQLAVLDEGLDSNVQSTVHGDEGADGAVEYGLLYQKALEDFTCSSDIAFRTLLKEFHDHQMLKSRKDGFGTEVLWVPFRKEELEAILDDLVM